MTFTWTDERTAEAQRLWKMGTSASEIAAGLGGTLTRSAVIGKMHRTLGAFATPTKPQGKVIRPKRVSRAKPRSAVAKAHKAATSRMMPRDGKVRAPTPIKPRAAPQPLGLKILTDLSPKDCRWVCDVLDAPEAMFCAQPIAQGAWCAHHAKIGYVTPTFTASQLARSLRKYAA